MIKVEHFAKENEDFDYGLLYHCYCLTCNDPTDTVLLLIETPDKTEAVNEAKQHEQTQGEGHSLVVNFLISKLPTSVLHDWESCSNLTERSK